MLLLREGMHPACELAKHLSSIRTRPASRAQFLRQKPCPQVPCQRFRGGRSSFSVCQRRSSVDKDLGPETPGEPDQWLFTIGIFLVCQADRLAVSMPDTSPCRP